MTVAPSDNSPHRIHMGIAEAGKVEALAGNHKAALRHYREAIRLAVSIKAPEVFFRHYTQCTLESLELMQDYNEVITFCKSADDHYSSLSLNDSLHARDHAGFMERLGIVLLKSENPQEAMQAFERAIMLARKNKMPLSETVINWLKRGYSPSSSHILNAQKQHKYFTVRVDQVDRSRAKPLLQNVGEMSREDLLFKAVASDTM